MREAGEARLLEVALRDVASDLASERACAARACVHVHARCGHALAAGLKSGGELDALLREQLEEVSVEDEVDHPGSGGDAKCRELEPAVR